MFILGSEVPGLIPGLACFFLFLHCCSYGAAARHAIVFAFEPAISLSVLTDPLDGANYTIKLLFLKTIL